MSLLLSQLDVTSIQAWITLANNALTLVVIGFAPILAVLYSRILFAQLQLQVEQSRVIEWPTRNYKAMVVTVRVKNIGRARVTKNGCYLEARDLIAGEGDRPPYLPVKSEPRQISRRPENEIFDAASPSGPDGEAAEIAWVLAPGEEAVEDVLIPLIGASAVEVAVRFDSRRGPIRRLLSGKNVANVWTSRRVLDISKDLGEESPGAISHPNIG